MSRHACIMIARLKFHTSFLKRFLFSRKYPDGYCKIPFKTPCVRVSEQKGNIRYPWIEFRF